MGKERNILAYLLSILVFTISASLTYAQISNGGNPHGKGIYYPKTSVVKMRAVEVHELERIQEYNPTDKNEPFQFAYPFGLSLNPSNSGEWTRLSNGDNIWKMEIESEGAYSLNLIFDKFNLPDGAEVYIYDPQGNHILGSFTSKNNKNSGILAVQPIPGDKLVVEFYVPSGVDWNAGSLSIGQVAHDFTGIFSDKGLKDGRFDLSGSCNVDINCTEGGGWQDHKKSVARIIINGTDLCTGVLVNNTSRDAKPYMLTAGHCIEDEDDASKTIAVFNYESPYCEGPDGFTTQSISGSSLKASKKTKMDFSLIQLSQVPPFYFRPYYAGWNTLGNLPSSTATIHHPQGDVKKISLDLQSPVTSSYGSYDANTFWKVLQWDVGTTEAGSSGAPLFDNLGLLTGTLTGGDASCGNSVNDYFQKFSEEWDKYSAANEQLKVWLDPLETGAVFTDGFDPYEPALKSCDSLVNYEDFEVLTLIPVNFNNGDDGYWTGHNTRKVTQYAEKIFNTSPTDLVEAIFHVGIVKYNEPTDSVKFKVWTGSVKPEDLIVSKSLPLSYFKDSMDLVLSFDTLIEFTGNFWLGYEIYYNDDSWEETDQFSLFQAEPRSDIGGWSTAYFYETQWTRFDSNYPYSMRTSLGIEALVCGEIPSLGIGDAPLMDLSDKFQLRPNPASDRVFVDIPEQVFGESRLKVYNLTGSLMMDKLIPAGSASFPLSLSGLRNGIYILRLEGVDFIANKKLSVID